MQSRLREIYEKQIVPELVKEFGYTNPLAVPKLTKIVLNMGVGEAVADKKKLDAAAADLTAIAAQKSVITHAKSQLQHIVCAKVSLLVPRSRCVGKECTTFWTS